MLFRPLIAVALFATVIRAQTPGPLPGDSLVLTRRAAIDAALAHNPQLEIARQQTAQSRARKVQAVAIPDPLLAASLDDQPGFLKLGQAASKNVSVGMDIPFLDKFRLQGGIANADIQGFEAVYRSLQQQIAAQTSQSYDDLLVALKHRDDLQATRLLAIDFLHKTEFRFTGGTVAKLDVTRAQVAVSQAENDLLSNSRDIIAAQAALNRLVGRSIGAPVAPGDSLVTPPALPSVDVLETTALTSRPEIAAMTSALAGARATTRLAREYWLPDLTLGAAKDYATKDGVLFSAGIALPLPTFFWQHNRGEIAESQHHEFELTATERDLRAQISQDVRTAYANASTALKQVSFIHDQLLPSVQEAYRIASVSYGLGGSSALEVLDARRDLIDAQNQYAEALAAANSARSDLERAVGAPLDSFGAGRQP